MKVVQVNVTDTKGGGAARCAFNLAEGLQQRGLDSWMLVMQKNSDQAKVIGTQSWIEWIYYRILVLLNVIGIRLFYRGKRGGHTLGVFPNPFLTRKLDRLNPDLIHIHSTACSFVPIAALKRMKCPVIWTFHDMWPMVGGGHHPNEVPSIYFNLSLHDHCVDKKPSAFDRWIWRKKLEDWKPLPFQVITPSDWMKQWTKGSLIFENHPIEHIANAVDLEIFRNDTSGSELFGTLELKEDELVVLFGANKLVSDSNKGLELVLEAMAKMGKTGKKLHLILFGAEEEIHHTLCHRVTILGPITNYIDMRALYAAADVFLMASVFENLPFAVLEAMACETPVVAVSTGGVPEMISHKHDGYLMTDRTAEQMINGLEWAIHHPEWSSVKKEARLSVEHRFSMPDFLDHHLTLYNEVLKKS